MKVIQGKAGKSLKLQDIINDFDGNVLMVDTVNPNHIVADNLSIIDTIYSTVWCTNFISEYMDKIREYDLIIFEMNDATDMVHSYKELENLIKRPCVVTIQDNSLEELKIYEV